MILFFINFRDQMIAASLKQYCCCLWYRITQSFPRSDDRGLIEAKEKVISMFFGFIFPRSDDRGLIEALLLNLYFNNAKLFPRSDDRGLIEAAYLMTPSVAESIFPRSDDRGLIEARHLPIAHAKLQAISAI